MGQSKGSIKPMVCLLGSLLSLGVSVPSQAGQEIFGYRSPDRWGVDGQHGVLRVKGALTDSPCRLAMHSADQTVTLGTVARGDLSGVGVEGKSVKFTLSLTDCLAVENARMNRQTGQVPWSTNQPGVAVRFVAVDTDGTGRYVKANGVSGLGLVIKDDTGRALTLGQYSAPRLLPAGQSVLTYSVAPVRVPGLMSPGAFYAVIGFQLSYD